MTESEWLTCGEPDLLLEFLVGNASRDQLVEFVRQCWERVQPRITSPPHHRTVVEQFADLVDGQDDMDAATYAYEASLKAAGWAASIHDEQVCQAELLRHIVGNPFRTNYPRG